jgi:hypothetical protein
MGEGAGKFKTIRIVGRASGQAQARIANAATVVIHRLVRPLATEADRRASGTSLHLWRADDFNAIVRRDIFEKPSHCTSPLTSMRKDGCRGPLCNTERSLCAFTLRRGWTLCIAHAFFPAGGTCMAYEWDPRRARRARIIRFATALAISASAITVPVAVLLAAAPI